MLASRPVETLRAVLDAADQDAETHDQQDVADDRAGDGGLDEIQQALSDGENRDDEFGGVAQRRVEQAADAGAGVRRQLFGGVPEESGHRDDSQRRGDEQQGGRPVQEFA